MNVHTRIGCKLALTHSSFSNTDCDLPPRRFYSLPPHKFRDPCTVSTIVHVGLGIRTQLPFRKHCSHLLSLIPPWKTTFKTLGKCICAPCLACLTIWATTTRGEDRYHRYHVRCFSPHKICNLLSCKIPWHLYHKYCSTCRTWNFRKKRTVGHVGISTWTITMSVSLVAH